MKKLISAIIAAAMIVTPQITSFRASMSASATTSVLLGDANGDTQVNINDAVAIQQFLVGRYAADDYCFTAMDINQDGVVDNTDAYIIQYRDARGISSTARVNETYDAPINESRRYIKYDCSTRTSDRYLLDVLTPFETQNNYDDLVETMSSTVPQHDADHTNVVKLQTASGEFLGSGFVISNHVIATSANCVYRDDSFKDNVKICIYSDTSTSPIATFDASYIHIPVGYTHPGDVSDFNYALITVTGNLLDYASAWKIGVPSNKFSINGTDMVSTVSFNTDTRWISSGNPYSTYYDQYKLKTNATFSGYRYGGVMYHNSTFNSITTSAAIAVFSEKAIGGKTTGISMNPILLQFYKHNSNI